MNAIKAALLFTGASASSLRHGAQQADVFDDLMGALDTTAPAPSADSSFGSDPADHAIAAANIFGGVTTEEIADATAPAPSNSVEIADAMHDAQEKDEKKEAKRERKAERKEARVEEWKAEEKKAEREEKEVQREEKKAEREEKEAERKEKEAERKEKEAERKDKEAERKDKEAERKKEVDREEKKAAPEDMGMTGGFDAHHDTGMTGGFDTHHDMGMTGGFDAHHDMGMTGTHEMGMTGAHEMGMTGAHNMGMTDGSMTGGNHDPAMNLDKFDKDTPKCVKTCPETEQAPSCATAKLWLSEGCAKDCPPTIKFQLESDACSTRSTVPSAFLQVSASTGMTGGEFDMTGTASPTGAFDAPTGGATGADFTDAGVTGAGVTGGDFTDAGVTGGDFTGSGVTGGDFTGGDFTGSGFTGGDFTGGDFTGATGTFDEKFEEQTQEQKSMQVLEEANDDDMKKKVEDFEKTAVCISVSDCVEACKEFSSTDADVDEEMCESKGLFECGADGYCNINIPEEPKEEKKERKEKREKREEKKGRKSAAPRFAELRANSKTKTNRASPVEDWRLRNPGMMVVNSWEDLERE